MQRWVLPAPVSPITTTESGSSIREPSANAAIVACRIFGFASETESLESLDLREASVDQPALLAPCGPLGHLGLQSAAK